MRVNIRPTPAPAITGLTITSGVKTATLNWDLPTDPTYAKAQVWRGTSTSVANATMIAEVQGNTYTDASPTINAVSNTYYWVRAVNKFGRADGPWSASVFVKSQLANELEIAAGAVKAGMLDVAAISSITGQLADGSVTPGKLAVAAISSVTGALASGSVGTTQITDSAITSQKITANAITAGKIDANAVTAVKIAAGSVETEKIAANAIVAGKIAANAVVAVNIAAGAVVAEKIAAGAITTEKISAEYVYAGKVQAAQVEATDLSAVSAKIGVLRTAETGARTEIRDNQIIVVMDNNAIGVKIGRLI